jgi:hypothetical protein
MGLFAAELNGLRRLVRSNFRSLLQATRLELGPVGSKFYA